MRSLSASRRIQVIVSAVVIGLMMSLVPHSSAAATGASPGVVAGDAPWEWPVPGARRIVDPYVAPAHDYGPGHRGMDISAPVGADAVAPFDGVVAFRGTVVDRPLLTLEHPDGYVLTLEPLDSSLEPGDVVSRGDELGTISTGGHTEAGALHVGVRMPPEYLNPRPFFGAVERAVLLPCCAGA